MTVQPPGSGTLVTEILRLRKRIDELSRRSDPVKACRVRLSSDASLGVGDTLAAGGWTAVEDPGGWFTSGNPSYITVGYTGYYSIHFHAAATGGTNTATAGAKVLLNTTTISAGSIATQTKDYPSNGADGSVIDAIRPRIPLSKGDLLYWSTYSSVSYTLKALMFGGVQTEIDVIYLGP